MNKGILTVGIILLALIALNLLAVLNNYATGSELDYYLLKETTDAAMLDALDPMYERFCGLYRLDKEKFAEGFIKRFAANVDLSRGYRIRFYDINEVPPRVSVRVDSITAIGFNQGVGDSGNVRPATISTSYDAIVESKQGVNVEADLGKKLSNSKMCRKFSTIAES